MNKLRFLTAVLFLGLPVFYMGCNGGNNDLNFSGNVTATLNVTGNYNVVTTPNSGLHNITLTQTGNRVRGVDNQGTVYTGTGTGDISTLTAQTTSVTKMIVTAITIQGTDANGRVITLALTSATLGFTPPASFTTAGTTVTSLPVQETNVQDLVFVKGLVGTYTDSHNLSGSIELVNNALQTDETI